MPDDFLMLLTGFLLGFVTAHVALYLWCKLNDEFRQ